MHSGASSHVSTLTRTASTPASTTDPEPVSLAVNRTRTWLEGACALASDRFAIELKGCGVDALVIHGACAEWSILVIDDAGARLEPADDLVGLSSLDAEIRMCERLGEPYRWFGIGPAGERLVRFATISGDNRHAGRGGLGAVLGSKRLKGIAVRGTTPTPLADAERVLALAKDVSKRSLGPATAKYRVDVEEPVYDSTMTPRADFFTLEDNG